MKTIKLTSIWLLVFGVLNTSELISQVYDFDWANSLHGTNNVSGGTTYGVTTNNTNFVYDCGTFHGTMDVDPGPTVNNMSATIGSYVRKLDENGNLVWAKVFSGFNQPGIEMLDITTHSPSNLVMITGRFYGTVDFDPGSSVYNMTSAGNTDLFLLVLSGSTGNFVRASRVGGLGEDAGTKIFASGNDLYVAGYFSGSFNANPFSHGPVTNLTSVGGKDLMVLKFFISGSSFKWGKSMGSVNDELGIDIVTTGLTSSPVYILGDYKGTIDVDPGAGVLNFLNKGVFISKLDNLGNFVWGKHIQVASSGQTILTPHCIGLDLNENVYFSGCFASTIDFDPSGSLYNMTASNGTTYLEKLDANGNFIYAKQFGHTSVVSGLSDLAVDKINGNVLITGDYGSSTWDFDPTVNIEARTAVGFGDVYVASYDLNGNLNWVQSYGGINNDYSRKIVLDMVNSIYIGGAFKGPGDFDPDAGTYTLPLAGQVNSVVLNGYLLKLRDTTIAEARFISNSVFDPSEEISLYPNPTSNKIFVTNASGIIEIYNSIGNLVISIESGIDEQTEVDLTHLSTGVYLFVIKSSGNKVTQKKVVKI